MEFVIQMRIACERELSEEVSGYINLINMIEATRLMNIVTHIGIFFENLVMEFIANISPECNIEESQKYKKVCVRGKYVRFSPYVINEHLKRSKFTGSGEVSLDKIAKEINAGNV